MRGDETTRKRPPEGCNCIERSSPQRFEVTSEIKIDAMGLDELFLSFALSSRSRPLSRTSWVPATRPSNHCGSASNHPTGVEVDAKVFAPSARRRAWGGRRLRDRRRRRLVTRERDCTSSGFGDGTRTRRGLPPPTWAALLEQPTRRAVSVSVGLSDGSSPRRSLPRSALPRASLARVRALRQRAAWTGSPRRPCVARRP